MPTVSIGFQTYFLEGEFSGGMWLDRRKKYYLFSTTCFWFGYIKDRYIYPLVGWINNNFAWYKMYYLKLLISARVY